MQLSSPFEVDVQYCTLKRSGDCIAFISYQTINLSVTNDAHFRKKKFVFVLKWVRFEIFRVPTSVLDGIDGQTDELA